MEVANLSNGMQSFQFKNFCKYFFLTKTLWFRIDFTEFAAGDNSFYEMHKL